MLFFDLRMKAAYSFRVEFEVGEGLEERESAVERNRTISRPIPPVAAKTRTFMFELELS